MCICVCVLMQFEKYRAVFCSIEMSKEQCCSTTPVFLPSLILIIKWASCCLNALPHKSLKE